MLALLATAGFVARQDDDPLKKIITQLQHLTDNFPVEKVYLQLDKPYYAIGDHIYFKSYTVVGSKHQPSGLSKVLYVELINDQDSIKQAVKVPMTAGLSWGSFDLADTLKAGSYHIRAYTQYMRNFDEDYFYDHTISIGNSISNTVFTLVNYHFSTENNTQQINAVINFFDLQHQPYANKPVSYQVKLDFHSVLKGKGTTDANGNLEINFKNTRPDDYKSGQIIATISPGPKEFITKTIPVQATSANVDVQFFPESGNLVSGIRSKVAFKAVGADGLGVNVHGTVVDNQNKPLATFSSQHLGMGIFALLPTSGQTYTANVTFPDGSTKNLPLPKVNNDGFVLSIDNRDSAFVYVHVSVSSATFQQKQNTDIVVVGQSAGEVVYAAKSKLVAQSFEAKVAKNRFPSGITQFTIFDDTGQPLNERIIFVRNPVNRLDIQLNKPETTSPRQKVDFEMAVLNHQKKPVAGNFSVSVTDETKVPVDENKLSTILSNLLLTSDIKGYVEEPNYYFANPDQQTDQDLDALMLTQGYRRFSWPLILNNHFPTISFQPEQSMSISGTVTTLGGKPVEKAKVTLFTTSKGTFVLDTVTNIDGHFTFNLVYPDSIRFVIQATRGGRKNLELKLDEIQPQFVTKNKNRADVTVNMNSAMTTYLRNSKDQYDDLLKYGLVHRTIILPGVTINEKRDAVKHSANLNGAGNADQVVRADQLFSGCINLEQCLQGRLLGVIFRNGVPYSTRSQGTPMQIIIDGVYVDADYFNTIVPTDVATIEVLRSGGYTSIYGGRGGGGVLLITTKRGDDPSYVFQRYTPNIVTYSPKGFTKTKEFYAPKYDDPKTNKEIPDLRSTIYWNPNINTDSAGQAKFSFFNADSKGNYRVVVEGIDDNGDLAHQVYHYKVE